MGIIAIAANPASGRDIRRFVSSATVFNNREKQNIVERIILAASNMGDHRFCIMPDSYHFAERIRAHLAEDFHSIDGDRIYTPHLPYTNSQKDTRRFAELMEKEGAGVLIVLGGDGTSRVAAGGISRLPLISISTGTNNVFPEVIEGTAAGMAAAALLSGLVNADECCGPCKRIEIWRNGELCDLALVDVVFSDYEYSGSKAIWNREDISRVVVTRCHPATIGFSSIPGSRMIVTPEEDAGAVAECGNGEANTRVSLAAGMVASLQITQTRKLNLGEKLDIRMEKSGMLALDGEREVGYQAGDVLTLCVRRNGPRRVDIHRTLELAQARGFFCIKNI